MRENTQEQEVSAQQGVKCPKCGALYPNPFDECPSCGVIVSRFLELQAGPSRETREERMRAAIEAEKKSKREAGLRERRAVQEHRRAERKKANLEPLWHLLTWAWIFILFCGLIGIPNVTTTAGLALLGLFSIGSYILAWLLRKAVKEVRTKQPVT